MMSKSKFEQTVAAQTATARRLFEVVPADQAWTIKQLVTAAAKAGINSDYGILAGCLNTMKKAGLVLEPTDGCFVRAPYREVKVKPLRGVPTVKDEAAQHQHTEAYSRAHGAGKVATEVAALTPQEGLQADAKLLADVSAARVVHKTRPNEPLVKHLQATKPDGKVTPTDRLGNFAAGLRNMAEQLEAMSIAAGNAAEAARQIAHGIEFEALSFEQVMEDNTAALAKLRSLKGMFEGI